MFYWIFNKILPFLWFGGLIAIIVEVKMISPTEPYCIPMWFIILEGILCVLFSILGGIYGRKAWDNDQSPRIFWIRTKNQEYDSKWKAIKDGAFTFFFIPANLFYLYMLLLM